MKRICTRSSDLIANITKVKNWFRERGYLEEILNKETKRVLESSISSSNRKSTPAPFISFHAARTLRTHLVRTKVYPVEETLMGQEIVLETALKFVKML